MLRKNDPSFLKIFGKNALIVIAILMGCAVACSPLLLLKTLNISDEIKIIISVLYGILLVVGIISYGIYTDQKFHNDKQIKEL